MEDFGRWLRERRLDLGYTLQSFADKCNLSYVTLSTIELGKSKAGINATKKIAKGLGIEYIELRKKMKEFEEQGE